LIRRVGAAEVRPLRHLVLRPAQPFEETLYAGDDDPATVHFGAFDGDRLVGVASLYREDRPGGTVSPGWRLRGMATDPGTRSQGHGRRLLDACVEHVSASGGGELWFNARSAAVAFYRAAGFEVVSDEFDIAGIGGHHIMRRVLSAG
jgi:L-Ala-D/L-Glu epimerase